MWLDLLALGLGLVVEALKDFRVLTGVDGEHAAVEKGAILLSDCLVLVLGVDVLENLLGVERVAVVVVALDPQPRREVVLVVGDVDVVLAEVLLALLQSIIPADFHETPLVPLALDDLLLGQLADAAHRRGRRQKILFVRVGQQLVGLGERLLPLPAEVGELIARLDELLGRKHTLCLVVLVGGRELGIEEALYTVQHQNIINGEHTAKKTPTVGLEPTTIKLRAQRSTN